MNDRAATVEVRSQDLHMVIDRLQSPGTVVELKNGLGTEPLGIVNHVGGF